MSVHLVAYTQGKLSELRAMLAPHSALTSSLPGDEDIGHGGFDAVVIVADLKAAESGAQGDFS
jgi:hypothetical protein